MDLLGEILAEISEVAASVLYEQAKSEKARKDKFRRSSKEAEDFFKSLGQKSKNKNNKKNKALQEDLNVQKRSSSSSMRTIEVKDKKNVEQIPLEERLINYKKSKRSIDKKQLERQENDHLTFTNLEKSSVTKKYKQILKSSKGAKDAFIYSTIFERKV